MCADVIDIDTAATGKQRAGAYMSIWSMVRKGSYALGTAIGLGLASYWGFNALADPRDTTNSDFSLLMLACTYSVIPALFKFVGMPLLWIYPLTESKLREVQTEINRRHGLTSGWRTAENETKTIASVGGDDRVATMHMMLADAPAPSRRTSRSATTKRAPGWWAAGPAAAWCRRAQHPRWTSGRWDSPVPARSRKRVLQG